MRIQVLLWSIPELASVVVQAPSGVSPPVVIMDMQLGLEIPFSHCHRYCTDDCSDIAYNDTMTYWLMVGVLVLFIIWHTSSFVYSYCSLQLLAPSTCLLACPIDRMRQNRYHSGVYVIGKRNGAAQYRTGRTIQCGGYGARNRPVQY
jgi:hypothetical protein